MSGECSSVHPLTIDAARVRQLADKYDLRLPRYTSYPTAPHFHPGIDPDQYATWLSELPENTPASLYLHIAYCAEMCFFCGCHARVSKRHEPVADYLEVLLKEAELISRTASSPLRITHIHFGGGSPTLLTGDELKHTTDHLRKHFNVADDAEIALEMDPRTATEEYVIAMAKAGFTRASLGVQDMADVVQKSINRIQPMETVENAFNWLHKHGITDINMDLMYGLPHQTTESMLGTMDKVMALKPARVSLFGYAHVPWVKANMKAIDENALPGAAERWDQYLSATANFARLGYVQIGLDHFAAPDDEMAIALKEGKLHRNFQGYTTDTAPALIGMGASGIGYLPQGYVANELDIDTYKSIISEGKLATRRGVALTDEDRLRRDVIERLMCDLKADLGEIAAAYNRPADYFAPELAQMDDLEADGVVARDGQVIQITDLGRTLVRAVCAKFDQYLKPGETRHSRAV
ncbi:oxygen-independent coproporphyrinogen III oxidase [Phaeovibrio sulfidiphilus]|uniref:Coproporphyrinogen-III oxidase n=1 Tax=Phaeovibrio sulfidiphilus TaxID=1220600 RepID=A0A8J6YPY0_9PROT|nr:oxygen-independent coproporphyrinogen III oxidase [Phaeovibrio sulfidiphilus]MBE1237526.1 oxygen-independent coproporphyrinogen III oxidase [Phaeovibrio sulfidiphilus]